MAASNETPGTQDQLGVDPLGDADRLGSERRNYAKVGSARPSSLLYTYGPGSIIDLPHFTVLPTGLDDWERIYARRPVTPTISAPRLLESVRRRYVNVRELRPFPWQANESGRPDEGRDLGVPARLFPQWFRCTGCDRLATIDYFKDGYRNTNPYAPHDAEVTHRNCPGRAGGAQRGKAKKAMDRPCVPARYILVCPDGHMDEFPYDWWVHHGKKCPEADSPVLAMEENPTGRGSGSIIVCKSCGARRRMQEAQGADGRKNLPKCRGRHPHLDTFEVGGCDKETRLMLVGASNLWFPATQSIVDLPRTSPAERLKELVNRVRSIMGDDLYEEIEAGGEDFEANIRFALKRLHKPEAPERIRSLDRDALLDLMAEARSLEDQDDKDTDKPFDPVDLLVPEWDYLQGSFPAQRMEDEDSGLTLSHRDVPESLLGMGVSRVIAIDRLRKVNALTGFTRIDAFDRTDDAGTRLVGLSRRGPFWIPATEDRGEGMFIQLDEGMVSDWESRVLDSELWERYRESNARNYRRRLSETAVDVDPDTRLAPPRYWLVHTLAHVLIRQMSLYSGYGIASISERLYAWQETPEHPAATGMMIVTTASDSDGTLGGLVGLSDPYKLESIFMSALDEAKRCSSDPVCAARVPVDPEDFLHGAACHCCAMLPETSCERSNRFLDRRFLVPLPGKYSSLAFFGGA